MVDHVLQLPENTRLMILAPLIVGRKGEQVDLFDELRAQASCGCASTARCTRSTPCRSSGKNVKHTVEVVVDRSKCARRSSSGWLNRSRTAQAFRRRALAVEMDGGATFVLGAVRVPGVQLFAAELERGCSRSTIRWVRAALRRSRTVSFSIPSGSSLSAPVLASAQSALDRRNQFYFQMLSVSRSITASILKRRSSNCRRRCRRRAPRLRTRQDQIPLLGERGNKQTREHAFEGIIPSLERRYRETDSVVVREELAKH